MQTRKIGAALTFSEDRHPLTSPYWWEFACPGGAAANVQPASADVAIVGAGYTGLAAALTLARAGRSVAVFDAEAPGWGASSRNGGMLGPSLQRLDTDALRLKYGEPQAHALLAESMEALDYTMAFIDHEGIECDLVRVGRFRGAVTGAAFEAIAQEAERLNRLVDLRAEIIPRNRQRSELGTDFYRGGVVYHRDAGLNPAKYHAGLLTRACAAGATVLAKLAVTGVRHESDGWRIATRLGVMSARDLLVATNAYTGKLTPGLRRRIIPVRSAIVATEPLPGDMMRRLMPKSRMVGDTRRLLSYYRPSPDGTRILFGGRIPGLSENPARILAHHRAALVEVFPELLQTHFTHVWSGLIAYTFDHSPHLGRLDGMYYAMGYCGSGVGRATWFGRKAALKILGDPEGASVFDGLAFQTRPLYTGNPWFLPALLKWHEIADRLSGARHRQ